MWRRVICKRTEELLLSLPLEAIWHPIHLPWRVNSDDFLDAPCITYKTIAGHLWWINPIFRWPNKEAFRSWKIIPFNQFFKAVKTCMLRQTNRNYYELVTFLDFYSLARMTSNSSLLKSADISDFPFPVFLFWFFCMCVCMFVNVRTCARAWLGAGVCACLCFNALHLLFGMFPISQAAAVQSWMVNQTP